jgi:hypothetical protein
LRGFGAKGLGFGVKGRVPRKALGVGVDAGTALCTHAPAAGRSARRYGAWLP